MEIVSDKLVLPSSLEKSDIMEFAFVMEKFLRLQAETKLAEIRLLEVKSRIYKEYNIGPNDKLNSDGTITRLP